MAISTYAELQTAVANWLNRSDLTARIPEFITLAEGRINSELRLGTMETESSLSSVIGSRTIALPSGFLQPIALWREDAAGRVPIPYRSPATLPDDATDGEADYWTVDGTNIAFDREAAAVQSFTLRSVARLNIASTSTNWLLTNHPQAYLAGTLAEGFAYLLDMEAATAWEQKFRIALSEAQRFASRSRGTPTLQVDSSLMGRGSTSLSGFLHGRV